MLEFGLCLEVTSNVEGSKMVNTKISGYRFIELKGIDTINRYYFANFLSIFKVHPNMDFKKNIYYSNP